jgi:signal transduction histidine kinase
MSRDSLRQKVERYAVGDLLTRRVLIVDDESENLEVLEALLSDHYGVVRAESADQALRILAATPVDVVISDQRMPGLSGVQLLERVEASWPDVAGIVLTAYTDSPAMLSAINDAHVFRFLTKPFDPDAVLGAVAEASERVYDGRAISALVDQLSARHDDLSKALSDLQAAQAQLLHLERLGTMGRLATGVVHDLRNFLMGLSYLEVEVETQPVSESIRESVEIGLSGLRNLLGTLESLNQFARGGRLGIERSAVAPGKLVRDAVTVMRGDLDFRRRGVTVHVDEGLPEVQGDPGKLTQVLVNLLRNAVQATASGQAVRIEATRGDAGGVVLAVEDEGPGVPEGLKERIFEPFVSTKGDQGMGMGLYMVRLVVESHGGRVACRAGARGGTRFEIALAPG